LSVARCLTKRASAGRNERAADKIASINCHPFLADCSAFCAYYEAPFSCRRRILSPIDPPFNPGRGATPITSPLQHCEPTPMASFR
jgi:hypothetical protein